MQANLKEYSSRIKQFRVEACLSTLEEISVEGNDIGCGLRTANLYTLSHYFEDNFLGYYIILS